MHAHAAKIESLERRFWQSMVDKDPEQAMTMIADECLVTGPMGTMRINPEQYGKMTDEGEWRLDEFELSDVNVVCPTDDTAVIAYKVHQTGAMKGQRMDLNCADSSAWVRDGGTWKCVLHTEAVIGEMPLTN